MVCQPKDEGGLGVLQLSTQNDAMLMKYLHKFYNKADLLWVHLIWDNYYKNGELPRQRNRGSFWWRDIMKLNNQYKVIAAAMPSDGSTILFWQDQWSGLVPMQIFPELHSFVKKPRMSFRSVWTAENTLSLFHLPLSQQAHDQLQQLIQTLNDVNLDGEKDAWSYIWETPYTSQLKHIK